VKRLMLRMVHEDDGVMSFEWVLMFTLLTIGIVSGLAAARDAVVDEMGDAAEAMVALDQSYQVDFPLMPYFTDPRLGIDETGGASDSGFEDFANAFDCTRGNNAPQGQTTELDEN
jgi:Flp pilus assembly pilin Flp